MADALTFPLPLETFFCGLRFTTWSFDLTQRMRQSETGGGEILTSDLSPRLWRTSVEVKAADHATQRKAEVKGRMLQQAGRSFFAFDPSAAYPETDPRGQRLGAAVPQIDAIASDQRRMRVSGLPGGYEIPAGAFLSFEYGSPTRYALHQVVNGVQASDTGATTLFEVIPFIRPGAAAGTPVRLVRPFCKMLMVPGTWSAGSRRARVTDGFVFDAIQTLR